MHQHTKIDFTITYTGKGKPAIIVKFLCVLRYEDYIGAVVIVIAYMELYRPVWHEPAKLALHHVIRHHQCKIRFAHPFALQHRQPLLIR